MLWHKNVSLKSSAYLWIVDIAVLGKQDMQILLGTSPKRAGVELVCLFRLSLNKIVAKIWFDSKFGYFQQVE